jgi:aspartate/methionine/tyrosine aminotransferase
MTTTQAAALAGDVSAALAGPLPQTCFDDLYTAVYDILDDAKAGHSLVKLYKGSHGSAQPHPIVLGFGQFFLQRRRGLLAYACRPADAGGPPSAGSLERFDRFSTPRITTQEAFNLLAPYLRRDGEPCEAVLRYLVARTHQLGAYRGGSSGFDEESRAFAAAHFRSLGITAEPGEVLVFSGGAKGAFVAFCAALMMRREHDELLPTGGRMLAPSGYYQSLRLIPAVFGGTIDVVDELSGEAVRDWLARTSGERGRCVYMPLVNNADGRVLSRSGALAVAYELLAHNAAQPDNPVFVLADDVYAGSYLSPDCAGCSIASVTGADIGKSSWGRMSDWTLAVVTASKTFALPTARVAFAVTTSRRLQRAVAHYRTVFSHGRVPQATELMAAAAICWTPQTWIDQWNATYRQRLAALQARLAPVNASVGFAAFSVEDPQGGWYVPLRISRRLLPGASNGVDAFAVLLHYGGAEPDSGIGLLPGELFGHRTRETGFLLRATVAVSEPELRRFTDRLGDAARLLTGPDGSRVIESALARARRVADVDAILRACRY